MASKTMMAVVSFPDFTLVAHETRLKNDFFLL